jgi:hypothetical protein
MAGDQIPSTDRVFIPVSACKCRKNQGSFSWSPTAGWALLLADPVETGAVEATSQT